MVERASLLIDEHPQQVLPSLAAAIGLNESIFLQQLHYWLQQKPHIINGRPWVYNTLDDWHLQFPFWSKRTLERILRNLREGGFITTTNEHNASKIDRKLWYSINYDQLPTIELANTSESENRGVERPISTHPDNSTVSARQTDDISPDKLAVSGHRQNDEMGHKSVEKCPFCQTDDIDADNVAVQVNTRVERPISTHSDDVAASDRQCGGTVPDNMAVSTQQCDSMDHGEMAAVNCQDGGNDHDKVAGSLYGTETNSETTTETNSEITTTTTIQDPSVDSVNPQPEDVVVVLSHHGISESVARRLAQKYPQEYLLEKIEFLEFEQTRMTNLANPAGWLRRAIEDDYARPSGFQSASEIEAQQVAHAQREAALLETQRAERQARVEAEQARSKAKEAAEADKIAAQLASIDPTYGTTEALLQAWEEGVRYVAKSSLGGVRMLMDGLRETVLLAFEAGHAKIGIWDDPANYAFRQRGKQFLKECLAYAMRDTLGGRSGTYELVLLGAE